jgi:hypothetical protein
MLQNITRKDLTMDTEVKGMATDNIAAGLVDRGSGGKAGAAESVPLGAVAGGGHAGGAGADAGGGSGGAAGAGGGDGGAGGKKGGGEMEALKAKVAALEARASIDALLEMHAEIIAARLPGVPKELLELLPKTADKAAFTKAAVSMRNAIEKMAPKLPDVGGVSKDGGTLPHEEKSKPLSAYANIEAGLQERRH